MSESVNRPEPGNVIDERIVALVRWKARSLIGRTGLTRQDCPDLAQELLACLVVPLRGYESDRASRLTYACTLVNRFAANILRARRAAKRAGGPVELLPDDLPGADTTPTALALDVDAAVEALPEHLRRVARALTAETVTGAARALGISRSTVYARVREIRERAEFQKLVENLPTSPDTFRPNRE